METWLVLNQPRDGHDKLGNTFFITLKSQPLYCSEFEPYKKYKDRREGKGRRFCFVGRIYSIPCRASYFALDDFEE